MKHIVSVSLGTSKRDKREEVDFAGQSFLIERRGVDGDLAKFATLVQELDGKVDAIGFGGCDIYVVAKKKRYAFKQILNIANLVKKTPVVDGSGLKHTIERSAIEKIQEMGIIDLKKSKVLLVSAVDRFGMAEALDQSGASIVYGDFLFGMGLPIPLRSLNSVNRFAAVILPIITLLPLKWFYPTGEKQEIRTPKFEKYFQEADLICGDWHYIHKYMPESLPGKVILTQTIRSADLEFLKKSGIKNVITTTPLIGGETFATNVMEALLVSLQEEKMKALTEVEIMNLLQKLNWKPTVIELNS